LLCFIRFLELRFHTEARLSAEPQQLHGSRVCSADIACTHHAAVETITDSPELMYCSHDYFTYTDRRTDRRTDRQIDSRLIDMTLYPRPRAVGRRRRRRRRF